MAFPIVTGALTKRSGDVVSCSKNANTGNDFQGESQGAKNDRSGRAKTDPSRDMPQNGTDWTVPFWNGPRLRPAFVAQVLGQAMQTAAPTPSAAQTAYRRSGALLATTLDEHV
jgi:hypothetical protein